MEIDEKFKAVDRKAAEVMNIITGSELSIGEEEESVDMCKAIKGIREDAREDGIQQTKLEVINKMMKALNITAERAMEILEIPESDYPVYLSKLNK